MNNELASQLTTFVNMFDTGTLALLLVSLLALWLINWCIRNLTTRLMTRFPARRFTIMQLGTLLSFTLYIVGGTALVVGVLRPPQEFLLAIGGSAAVAMGFALKDIAASLVSGLILLFDRPFHVGDRVSFDGVYGEIIAITLRTVRLQTLDDNIVTIPNSRFITDVVASGNLGAMDMMVVTDFHLALDADIQQAEDIARQVIVTAAMPT